MSQSAFELNLKEQMKIHWLEWKRIFILRGGPFGNVKDVFKVLEISIIKCMLDAEIKLKRQVSRGYHALNTRLNMHCSRG